MFLYIFEDGEMCQYKTPPLPENIQQLKDGRITAIIKFDSNFMKFRKAVIKNSEIIWELI